jgi:hypothetical protein
MARFFVEFFREPDRHLGHLFGVITMGQLLSLPMIIAGLALLLHARSAAHARMSDAAVASVTVDRTRLEAGIARLIRAGGPIDVATFMTLALGHPTQGYYAACAGLGADGDFVTAPEVSQLFGELVGLSLASAWAASGTPPAHLVELGPGNGTLMADLWRGTARVPGFHDALTVHLVETSPRLRDGPGDPAGFDRGADMARRSRDAAATTGRSWWSPTSSSTRCRSASWSRRTEAGTRSASIWARTTGSASAAPPSHRRSGTC